MNPFFLKISTSKGNGGFFFDGTAPQFCCIQSRVSNQKSVKVRRKKTNRSTFPRLNIYFRFEIAETAIEKTINVVMNEKKKKNPRGKNGVVAKKNVGS